jgi:hypothetical protein
LYPCALSLALFFSIYIKNNAFLIFQESSVQKSYFKELKYCLDHVTHPHFSVLCCFLSNEKQYCYLQRGGESPQNYCAVQIAKLLFYKTIPLSCHSLCMKSSIFTTCLKSTYHRRLCTPSKCQSMCQRRLSPSFIAEKCICFDILWGNLFLFLSKLTV